MRREGTSVILLAALAVAGLLASCDGEDYSAIMRSRVKAALGDQFTINKLDPKHFKWLTYPTDNFGVATVYVLPSAGAVPSILDFYCDTWDCLGLAGAIPNDPEKRLSLSGAAAVGRGGVITLSESKMTKLGASAVLPIVAESLKLDAGIEYSKGVEVQLNMGRAALRVLRKSRLGEMVKAWAPEDPRKVAFLEGRLAVVFADVVVDSLQATIKVNSSLNPKLEAALSQSVGSFGEGTKFSGSLQRTMAGTYSLVALEPTIIAPLLRLQPAAGVLSTTEEEDLSWADWRPVNYK
jgi:hypothetical protein